MKKCVPGKQNVFAVFPIAAMVLSVVLSPMTAVLAAAVISPADGSGYTFYTDNAATASIPLSEAVTNENAAYFEIEAEDTYVKTGFQDLTAGSAELSISGSWTAYVPYTYYIALTELTETQVEAFGETLEVNADTVILGDGSGDTLILQSIRIIYDPDPPVISSIVPVPEAWAQEITLTVSAADTGELHPEAYSFDDGTTWQSADSMTFVNNGEIHIKVRDAAENESPAYTYTIDHIDRTVPTVSSVTVDPDVTHSTDPWRASAIITVDASDAESDLAAEAYSFDGGTHWQSSNAYTVTDNGEYPIWVRDAVGNVSVSDTVTIMRIDDIAPTYTEVTVFPDVRNSWNPWSLISVITVEGASDGETGLAAEAFSFDGGTHWQAANAHIAFMNGVYAIQIRDAAGNKTDCGTVSLIRIDEAPEIYIDESSISPDWSKDMTTMEFSIDDVGEGYELSGITGSVLDAAVTITPKPGVEDAFIATIIGDPFALINGPITIEVTDTLGNTSSETSYRPILIDNAGPAIVIDEATISDNWHAASTTFEFSADDMGSGVMQGSLSGTIPDGTVSVSPKPGYPGVYIATVTADPDSVIHDPAVITAQDMVGNSGQTISEKLVMIDNQGATVSELECKKTSGSPEMDVVKNGDVIQVSFALSDEGSGVDDTTVEVVLNGSLPKTPVKSGDVYACDFIVGTEIAGTEDTRFLLTGITAADNVGNVVTTAQDTDTAITYYAPIGDGLTDISFISSNADPSVAKSGDRAYVSFYTTHPILIKNDTISQKSSSRINWVESNNSTKQPGYYYHEGYRTLAKEYDYDNKALEFTLTVYDKAENNEVIISQDDVGKIIYYAPIVVTDIVIETDNHQDATRYAKDGDTVKVSFTTNHDVTVTEEKIAGKGVDAGKSGGKGIRKQWTMTYTLKNGDLADLSDVPFSFAVDDAAGNPSVNRSHDSADVTNTIQYYAPITATTSIYSSNRNINFAMNTDTVTVTGATNHNVNITNASIAGRKTVDKGGDSTNVEMAYTIPSGEEAIAEGLLPFDYVITDAAGNTLDVNQTNDLESSAVTYDRTPPLIGINPNPPSYTAEAVTFSITFADAHLSGSDISVLLNGEEQMSGGDRRLVSGAEYTKSITLETDGNYTIIASQADLAGNKTAPDATASVIIDMTNPVINAVGIDTSKPQAFMAGIKISDYFQFVDDNIRDIICTVTDSEGTRDWDINEALTGDGKKTINLIVTDMANNSSAPLTYDLYIDGTPPQPVIIDTVTGEALGSENTFISEMALSIGLEPLHIKGLNEADHFAMLKLMREDGALIVDFLATSEPDESGTYAYALNQFGKYVLCAEAVDEVGNTTGNMEYRFVFRDKSIFRKFYENTPLFAAVMVLVAAGIATVIFLRIRGKRNIGTN